MSLFHYSYCLFISQKKHCKQWLLLVQGCGRKQGAERGGQDRHHQEPSQKRQGKARQGKGSQGKASSILFILDAGCSDGGAHTL